METKTSKKKISTKAEPKESKDSKNAILDDKKNEKKSHPLIKGPRITEKTAVGAEKGVYTFNVDKNSSKNEIKKAIKTVYGVIPTRIAITKIADKKVFRRGVAGIKRGGKKAVVYLKKGDKIVFN